MNVLQQNLAILEKFQPTLAEELGRQAASRHIDLMPLEQAIPKVDALVVVGLPSAESWRRVLDSKSSFVIVSHALLPDLKAYLSVMDLREPLGQGRISFAVGDDGVLQVLNDLFGTLYRRSVTMFGQPGTPGHDEALKEMRFFDTLCAANRATLDQFAEEWQTNVSENLRDFLGGPFLEDESGLWSGGEAVVVAAGPSLDEVDGPAAFKGRPVVACDTAVPVLAMKGVTPDLIVTLDSSVSNQAYLRDLPERVYAHSVLCVTPLVDRQVYKAFRNVLFYSYGHPTLDHFRESGIPFAPLATGGSVALTAVDVVRLLGARRVYLLGFDFQYYPFRTHARGTGTALRGIRAANRYTSIEQFVYDYQIDLEAGPSQVAGSGTGRAALTDKKFQKWKDWLELYVKNNDLEIFQMSRSTAPVAGVSFGAPSGGDSLPSFRMRTRDYGPDIRRELKFMQKELEMAMSAPPAELARRVGALPRIGKCLGYVLAWLSDKPPEETSLRLLSILRRFHAGVSTALT